MILFLFAFILDVVISLLASIPGGWILMYGVNVFIDNLGLDVEFVDYPSGFVMFLWSYWIVLAVKFGFAISGGISKEVFGE